MIFGVRDVWDPRVMEILARDVLPELRKLG